MRTGDEPYFRSKPILFGLYKNYNVVIAAVGVLFFLGGCYAFVNDEEPPAWKDDPATAQDVAALSGGSGPGAGVFNAKCAVCHQMTGKGIPGVYPTLAGSELVTGDPRLTVRIVLHGFQGPIERGGTKFNGVMQPWKNDLSDQEIADVINYIRTNFGNAAAEITAETVQQEREATKSKSGAWTENELKSSL
jgi:mono/diheme cytochrome c family protein